MKITGRVQFYLPERHFGFVRHKLEPGSDRLDGKIYFNDKSLATFVEAGDYVEFDIERDDLDRTVAINVAPIEDSERLTGTVVKVGNWPYCFVQVDGRNGDDQQNSVLSTT